MITAIKVENLSKAYQLGAIGTGTLGNDLRRWYARTRGKEDPFLKIGEANDRTVKGNSSVVWSLRDINFEIEQGDAVGIIGRNGAGKSTLLKILSRVTAPTTGKITGNGRVASLLEVGTGFHPELTGRENIYLNGAILGMRKKEINRKFDQIVDFAGVERYIDTPVKRYSSGMYVRLAFAVAAHLESEILIVDEVLAVGDAEFQKKCLGKMGEVNKGEGRTILFVSHNMQSVSALTHSCILMEQGSLKQNGKTSEIIQSYYRSNFQRDLIYSDNSEHENKPFIKSIKLHTSHPNNIQETGKKLSIKFTIYNPYPLRAAALSYQICNSRNEHVLHILNLNSENKFCDEEGVFNLESVIPNIKLYPDDYYLIVHFADGFTKTKFQTIEGICPFEVKVFETVRDYYWHKGNAVYTEDSFWQINKT